eukprot:Pgem_evm2s14809
MSANQSKEDEINCNDDENGDSNSGKLYHERQSLMRCGVHCINNLLQKRHFTTTSFDDIARELHEVQGGGLINPHKSV